ncbi:MAG: agmatine deiminase family protein, partial [Bacteroidota bacterium]
PIGDYRTYTNSVFINGTILVPIYGAEEDELALSIYRDYFPGYKVVGIDCNEMIDELGAIHCITKLMGSDDPLLIVHPRLRDGFFQSENRQIEAWLYHESGIESATVYYRLEGDNGYFPLAMEPGEASAAHWTAVFPQMPPDVEVQYYIEAIANDGKTQRRPLPAPEAYYHFQEQSITQAPNADWVQQQQVIVAGQKVSFYERIKGGYNQLRWHFPGGTPNTAQGPRVAVEYPSPGFYDVILIASNNYGTDTLIQGGAVQVLPAFTPHTEDFSENLFLFWQIIPPEGSPVNWEWQAAGQCENGVLMVPHREAPQKLNRCYMRSALDLEDFVDGQLVFDVAYAQRNAQHFDELRVNIIGERGQLINIYNKGGDVLASVPNYIPNFAPTDCSQWRTDTIDLRPWTGQRFVIEMESIGDRGNSIFLDNIRYQAN